MGMYVKRFQLLLWFLILHVEVNLKTSFLESNVCQHQSQS